MSLVLHCGAREVTRPDLDLYPAPPPSNRWFPVSHADVMKTVESALEDSGFRIDRARYGLSKCNHKLFATLDIAVPVAEDIRLAVGVRNSTNQTFPLGFAAGHRVFVCDNLSFSAELMARRKHTRFGHTRFRDDITDCVSRLEAFRLAEAARIERMKLRDLSDTEAESYLLRAYERHLISHRQLPRIISEWREPSFEDFAPRTLWSLFNAFTCVMNERAKSNPQAHARSTMSLQALLAPKGADSPDLITPEDP